MRKNCSSDREKLLKFEAEGREFENILKSLEQFVQTVNVRKIFAFLTCSWRFLRYDKLEQLQFKLEKITYVLGFRYMKEKLENKLCIITNVILTLLLVSECSSG